MIRFIRCMVCTLLILMSVSNAQAKVNAEQAQQLQQALTPVGAERAGNAEGTIPTWQAGQIEYPPIKPGMHHPNPFADDQPRLVINAANMSAHQSKLSAAHQLMLQRYPDFQLKVYPTRRTATYPQRVYDAVYQNALHAELVEGGEGVIQATTSSPFPIPANAHEVMWNHKLRYRGEAVQTHSGSAVVDSKGRYTLRKTDTLIKFMYSDPQR
ncbi:MAG: DUF1329 domain-containing protein, partial [Ketobacter sp.]|nr:DUF1329 domain-containing protein [Ketobacter sp.]